MKQYLKKWGLAIFFISACAHAATNSPSSTILVPPAAQTSFPPANPAAMLGWVATPSSCINYCCGYYKDPLTAFLTSPLPPLETTSVQASADQAQFTQTGRSVLVGNVKLVQPGRTVSADKAYLNRDPKTGGITSVDLVGHVTLNQPGKMIVGDAGHLELHSKLDSFSDAVYHFALGGPVPFNKTQLTHTTAPLETNINQTFLNAWGVSKSIEQEASGIIVLKNSTYTTCPPISPTWKVSASTINLNQTTGRGTAYNSWLDVKGIPVFYTPYFSFPIDNRRQTGFLFPTMGHNSISGYSLSTPFYWNIAPNYDALITPTYYTLSGFQGNGLFRYLLPGTNGTINAGFLPHDSAFQDFKEDALQQFAGNPSLGRLEHSSDTRDYFAWNDVSQFNQNWKAQVNYNYVSDDYYLQDFNSLNPTVANQLPQSASIQYTNDIWTLIGKVQGYETLHPVNQSSVDNPYQSLPELDLNGIYPEQPYGLNLKLNTQFVDYTRSANPGEDDIPPGADRLNASPIVSWPVTGLPGYFTPTLQIDATDYAVTDQVTGYPNNIQRLLPLLDVDTGLYFDKDTRLLNTNYQQTLEPRLYYLYVPYVNQTNIPIFDSALVPFSYDSMFFNNRFSGLDRIGDANQVTFGLTTRFLNEDTGMQKFRASIGQIYYFRNRFVTTCEPAGTPGAVSTDSACVDNTVINNNGLVSAEEGTSSTEPSSPIAGLLNYNFWRAWSLTGSAAWDPHIHQTVNGSGGFQYAPKPNHILNLNYNFIRLGDPLPTTPPAVPPSPTSHENDLNQGGFSFAWPLAQRWSVVGGWNYDLAHHTPQNYLYGLEYQNCCWAVRAVGGRTFVALNEYNNPTYSNAFYIEWQLKGLGNIGNGDPATLLLSSIPGYQNDFNNFTALKNITL